jgi:predicted amidophosphoribosyltransferase
MSFFQSLLSIFVDIEEEKMIFSPQDLTEHYRREIPHCVLDGVFVAAHYRDIDRIIEGYKYRSEREKARVLSDLLRKLYLSRKKYLPISDSFRHREECALSDNEEVVLGWSDPYIWSTEHELPSPPSRGQACSPEQNSTDFPQKQENLPPLTGGLTHPREWREQVAICPVPMHWSRYLIRGFDHVAKLGEQLAKEEHVPFQKLLKAGYSKRQSKLQKSERVKNREHAFVLTPNIKEMPETVILIDDVISTGSTANACAEILKKAGVPYVYSFFLASNQ